MGPGLTRNFVVVENSPKPGAKIIKKNTKLDSKQTYRAKQYKVTSFLSTDCELSTNPCSKNVYNLGPSTGILDLVI